jgi:soluble cytochrome b562
MGHDWLFEVIADMKAYAQKHGMSALAAKLDETEAVARDDVAAARSEADRSLPGNPAHRRG